MSEQVLGGETSAPAPTDEKLNEVLVGSTWVERDEVGLRDRTWEDMNEEERSFAREWVKGMLMSPESVKMMGEYMDRKAEAQQRLWGSSLMEAEERAIDDWWKDEKGEI